MTATESTLLDELIVYVDRLIGRDQGPGYWRDPERPEIVTAEVEMRLEPHRVLGLREIVRNVLGWG